MVTGLLAVGYAPLLQPPGVTLSERITSESE